MPRGVKQNRTEQPGVLQPGKGPAQLSRGEVQELKTKNGNNGLAQYDPSPEEGDECETDDDDAASREEESGCRVMLECSIAQPDEDEEVLPAIPNDYREIEDVGLRWQRIREENLIQRRASLDNENRVNTYAHYRIPHAQRHMEFDQHDPAELIDRDVARDTNRINIPYEARALDDPFEVDLRQRGGLGYRDASQRIETVAPYLDDIRELSTAVASRGLYTHKIWRPGHVRMIENMGGASHAADNITSACFYNAEKVIGSSTQCDRTFQLYPVLARACSMWSGTSKMKIAGRDRLGLSEGAWTSGPTVERVFVGMSPSFDTVFMSAPKNKVATDNITTYTLNTEPKYHRAGKTILLHEYLTVPGNVKALGKLMLGEKVKFNSELCPRSRAMNSNKKAMGGMHAPPPVHRIPSQQKGTHTPHLGLKPGQDGDSHWSLKWPPLAALAIPSQMVDLLNEFLSQHPMDPVPVNLAVAATIIYFDMEKRDWDVYCWKDAMVPQVPLGTFIIYFAHMLRFVETLRLTRYPHPLIFAKAQYGQDQRKSAEFRVKDELLDVMMLRRLYTCITSSTQQISYDRRLVLLPHSMPGTMMRWPLGTGTAEPPSESLFALAMLNDIRTLMIPSYHLRTEPIQMVGCPQTMAELWCRDSTVSKIGWAVPPTFFWFPELEGSIVSLTGEAMLVGPVMEPVTGVKLKLGAPEAPGRVAVAPVGYAASRSMGQVIAPEVRTQLARDNEIRIRIAMELGVPTDNLYFCREDLVFKWEGLEAEITTAFREGRLNNVEDHRMRQPPSETGSSTEDDATNEEDGQGRSKMLKSFFLSKEEQLRLGAMLGNGALAHPWELVKSKLTSEEALSVHSVAQLACAAYLEVNEEVFKLRRKMETLDPEAGQLPALRENVILKLPSMILILSGAFPNEVVGSVENQSAEGIRGISTKLNEIGGSEASKLFKTIFSLMAAPDDLIQLAWPIVISSGLKFWTLPFVADQLNATEKLMLRIHDMRDRIGAKWDAVDFPTLGKKLALEAQRH
ncbi:hypothetical protein BGZ63DRAFT_448932 [Mariannaea sp. PMI_226]|nr:hypothetical protein BGZ63DRAFT_448932 [Mariannaea sp. PMI_226]